MNSKRNIGIIGEQIASDYLFKKGYKIIARNYYVQQGELDIVAEKSNKVIFIEVKTRTTDKYGSGAEAVTKAKQQNIIKTALSFIQKEKVFSKVYCFDVIEVYLSKEQQLLKINHIPEAFGCN